MSKKHRGPKESGSAQPKEVPFNRALWGLQDFKKDLLAAEQAAEQAKEAKVAEEHKQALVRKAAAESSSKRSMDLSDDDPELFLRAVTGIKRMGDDPRGQIVRPPKAVNETFDLIDFASTVDPENTLQPHDEGEQRAGHSKSLDKRVLKTLMRGEIAFELRADLHGLSRIDALSRVERLFGEARQKHARCVLVITGRGLGSADGPVLKEALVDWLAHGKLTRYVLAYAQARPQDGGEGAYYILLRRR